MIMIYAWRLFTHTRSMSWSETPKDFHMKLLLPPHHIGITTTFTPEHSACWYHTTPVSCHTQCSTPPTDSEMTPPPTEPHQADTYLLLPLFLLLQHRQQNRPKYWGMGAKGFNVSPILTHNKTNKIYTEKRQITLHSFRSNQKPILSMHAEYLELWIHF